MVAQATNNTTEDTAMQVIKNLISKLFTPAISEAEIIRKSFTRLFPNWMHRDFEALSNGLWSKGMPRYKANAVARFLMGEEQPLSNQDLRLAMRTLLILETPTF